MRVLVGLGSLAPYGPSVDPTDLGQPF